MRDPENEQREINSPYGPQHDQVDQAAGGADSSPLEDVPTGKRPDAASQRHNSETPRSTPQNG